jgi:hypothetical protein
MKLQNLIHILIGIVCIGLLPGAQVLSPAPDGGYPGMNTAEGEGALFSLATGENNTAVGWQARFGNTTGGGNTAIGSAALQVNTRGHSNTAVGNFALPVNTTGDYNTAVGEAVLESASGWERIKRWAINCVSGSGDFYSLTNQKIRKENTPAAGEIIHYMMGGISGAIYGVAAEITPLATEGRQTAALSGSLRLCSAWLTTLWCRRSTRLLRARKVGNRGVASCRAVWPNLSRKVRGLWRIAAKKWNRTFIWSQRPILLLLKFDLSAAPANCP